MKDVYLNWGLKRSLKCVILVVFFFYCYYFEATYEVTRNKNE